MKLSKAHKDKLRSQGFSAKDIADIEAATVEDEAPANEDEGRRVKPKRTSRVFMLEGDDAESLLERLFGSSDETPDDETPDDETPDDEGEPEPEPDDTPDSSVRYFRGKRASS